MPVCVYGHKIILSAPENTHINCPQCNGTMMYGNATKYFTLFFIPIFPYKDLGMSYQCKKCKKIFQSSGMPPPPRISTPASSRLSSSTSTSYIQQQAAFREMESHYTKGIKAFENSEYKEAIEHFKALLRLKGVPNEVRGVSYQILSRSYALREKWEGALFYSDKLFTMPSANVEPSFQDYVLRIQASLATGDTEKADRALEMTRTRFGHAKEFKELERVLKETGSTQFSYYQVEKEVSGTNYLTGSSQLQDGSVQFTSESETSGEEESRLGASSGKGEAILCPSCNTEYPADTEHTHCLFCNAELPL
ncbi:MAG: zinc-ribbon domain-containing protein [Candidatus Odinarchaeota archaeon]